MCPLFFIAFRVTRLFSSGTATYEDITPILPVDTLDRLGFQKDPYIHH
jgi:hypothetical protein